MRKRNRFILNSALVGAAITVGKDVCNQYQEITTNGQRLTLDNLDKERLGKNALLGAGFGSLVGLLYYNLTTEDEKSLPFCPDAYLNNVLTNESLKSDKASFEEVLRVRAELKSFLQQQFEKDLAFPPRDAGSFAKRTANLSAYDLDLLLVFRYNAVRSLQEMVNVVYNELEQRYARLATVKQKNSSIHLVIPTRAGDIYVDVKPGRQVHEGGYVVNFLVAGKYFWQNASYEKANIQLQRRLTVNKPAERQVVKLLKRYKQLGKYAFPNVVIEQAVVAALSKNKYGLDYSITENLLNAMYFLGLKIVKNKMSEISNPNKNLLAGLSRFEKTAVASQLFKDVRRIEQNPRYLKEIFG